MNLYYGMHMDDTAPDPDFLAIYFNLTYRARNELHNMYVEGTTFGFANIEDAIFHIEHAVSTRQL